MKVLNLIIKQEYFDEIISGEKKQEFREVKPTTVKKLIQLDEEGYEREDEYGNAIPVEYDAIKFAVGYRKDRDTALVEVKGVHSEIFTEPYMDEEGNAILFKCRGGKPIFFATDEDGYFLQDKDGKYIEVDEDYGAPMPVEGDEEGMIIEHAITYEYNERTWVAEQVVYDLGEILEQQVKEKPHTLCGGIVMPYIDPIPEPKKRFELRCHECDGSDYHCAYYDTREEAEAYIAARDKKDPQACLYEHLYVVERNI